MRTQPCCEADHILHCNCIISHRLPYHISPTSFLQAIREQFRRDGNVYFLVMGCLMAIGWYTDAFDSAISPWTTLVPSPSS